MPDGYGDAITIDASCMEDLAAALDKFPLMVQQRMLQKSLEQGAIVVRESIVAAAPVRSDDKTPKSTSLPAGWVKADIRIAPRKSGRGWLIGGSSVTAHVIRWLEFGHLMVVGGFRKVRTGRGPGKLATVGTTKNVHVPAYPFLRPGFDASWRAGLNAIYSELQRQIADYWRRELKRGKRAA